jgi:predicted phosphodiesterase
MTTATLKMDLKKGQNMPTSKKRIDEIRASVEDCGVDATASLYGLSRETVRRYVRKRGGLDECVSDKDIADGNPILSKIAERYSEKELKLLAGGGLPMEYKHTPVHSFHGDELKIGWIGDTHVGSVYTDYDNIRDAREMFAKEGVDFIVHTGDVTEGASNRPGHVYECSEYGYDAQKKKAIEVFGSFDFCPVYMIDGNHDRWYMKSSGAKIVQDICEELPCAEFIGHDEGDIIINDNCTVKLWHGEDGSSYAHSYRIQKLVESWQGGQKPSILYTGHVHKHFYVMERNIHCVSTGCIQKQSKWMRGKRLPAHTGFGIDTVTINDLGVGRFKHEFFPFYA